MISNQITLCVKEPGFKDLIIDVKLKASFQVVKKIICMKKKLQRVEEIILMFSGKVLSNKDEVEKIFDKFNKNSVMVLHMLRKKEKGERKKKIPEIPVQQPKENAFNPNSNQINQFNVLLQQQQILFQSMFKNQQMPFFNMNNIPNNQQQAPVTQIPVNTAKNDPARNMNLENNQRDQEVLNNENENVPDVNNEEPVVNEEAPNNNEERFPNVQNLQRQQQQVRNVRFGDTALYKFLVLFFKTGILSLFLTKSSNVWEWFFSTTIMLLIYGVMKYAVNYMNRKKKEREEKEKREKEKILEETKRAKLRIKENEENEIKENEEKWDDDMIIGNDKPDEEEEGEEDEVEIEIRRVAPSHSIIRKIFDIIYLFFASMLPTYNIYEQ